MSSFQFICSISHSAYHGLYTFFDMPFTEIAFTRASVSMQLTQPCMIKEKVNRSSYHVFYLSARKTMENTKFLSQESHLNTEKIQFAENVYRKVKRQNSCKLFLLQWEKNQYWHEVSILKRKEKER